MLDSLYSGISGLNAFQKTLNTEANNIANVNTIAYKSDVMSFADLMYQEGIGKGTSIINVKKDFTQGEFKLTGNAYDMAIDGRGFFTVQDSITKDTYYTRAGNFSMSVDGFLQTPSGEQVMGINIDAPDAISTNPAITQFGNTHTSFLGSQNISSMAVLKTINAKATNYVESATTGGIHGDGYKQAGAKIRDIEELSTEYRKQLSLYAIDPTDGTTSNAQVSSVIFPISEINEAGEEISIYIENQKYTQYFDTDTATTLNKLSDQISNLSSLTSSVDVATGAFTVKSLIPGKDVIVSGAETKATNGVVTNQTLTTEVAIKGTGLASLTSVRDALKTAVENADAEFLELTDTIDLSKEGSLTLTNLQLKLDILKVSENSFGDFSVDNGALYMSQGDNRFLVGKVVTSIFADKEGLNPEGNNLFTKTKESGDALYSANMNKVSNEIIELSNADFSEGLVNMMTFQRSFEASSKVINTADEILKTAMQLKK